MLSTDKIRVHTFSLLLSLFLTQNSSVFSAANDSPSFYDQSKKVIGYIEVGDYDQATASLADLNARDLATPSEMVTVSVLQTYLAAKSIDSNYEEALRMFYDASKRISQVSDSRRANLALSWQLHFSDLCRKASTTSQKRPYTVGSYKMRFEKPMPTPALDNSNVSGSLVIILHTVSGVKRLRCIVSSGSRLEKNRVSLCTKFDVRLPRERTMSVYDAFDIPCAIESNITGDTSGFGMLWEKQVFIESIEFDTTNIQGLSEEQRKLFQKPTFIETWSFL